MIELFSYIRAKIFPIISTFEVQSAIEVVIVSWELSNSDDLLETERLKSSCVLHQLFL